MSGARRGAGELETAVLQVLWAAEGPLIPAEVLALLGSELAYTTVMTVLNRLTDKGLVQRLPAGRAFAYRPLTGPDELAAERMARLLQAGSDRSAVLSYFVGSLTAEDEQRLRELLSQAPDQPR